MTNEDLKRFYSDNEKITEPKDFVRLDENGKLDANIFPGTYIKKVEVTNITEIDSSIINNIDCGDIIIKNEDGNKHTYIVSYKENEQGICLTYTDASVVETVSYDYNSETGEWDYNSTDVTHIAQPTPEPYAKIGTYFYTGSNDDNIRITLNEDYSFEYSFRASGQGDPTITTGTFTDNDTNLVLTFTDSTTKEYTWVNSITFTEDGDTSGLAYQKELDISDYYLKYGTYSFEDSGLKIDITLKADYTYNAIISSDGQQVETDSGTFTDDGTDLILTNGEQVVSNYIWDTATTFHKDGDSEIIYEKQDYSKAGVYALDPDENTHITHTINTDYSDSFSVEINGEQVYSYVYPLVIDTNDFLLLVDEDPGHIQFIGYSNEWTSSDTFRSNGDLNSIFTKE